MKKQTYMSKKIDQQPKWYLVDATNEILGKLAVKISHRISGKDNPKFVPYLDMGDHVVVINAEKIQVTGNKEDQKLYRSHSGFPGGLKETTLKEVRARKPEELLRKAVWGMLPKTRMGRAQLTKLHIYKGDKHPYQNTKFETLN